MTALNLVWLSDLHFSANENVVGHNPRLRLSAAIDFINRHHSNSSGCVISGDLVNRATREDYHCLKIYLDKLTIPYFVMTGNHDNRQLLRSTFDLPENCMSSFIQYPVTTDEYLILCLDTLKSGFDSGEFCTSRMDWLSGQLAMSQDTPVLLFMHHPPMELGLPIQDTDNLENGDEFLNAIVDYANIKHLFIGHVHRPICGSIKGIPFSTMRSVLFQAPAPQPHWDWNNFTAAREAPQLGIVRLDNQQLTIQYTQFCDYGVGTDS